MKCKNCNRLIAIEPKSREWIHTDYPYWFFKNGDSYFDKMNTQFYSADKFALMQYVVLQKQHAKSISCLPQFSRNCYAKLDALNEGTHSELYDRLLKIQDKSLHTLVSIPMESYWLTKLNLQVKANEIDKFKFTSVLSIGLETVTYTLGINDRALVAISQEPLLFPKYDELKELVNKELTKLQIKDGIKDDIQNITTEE